MNSLILKDLIALKSYGKQLVILITLFTILSFRNKDINLLSGTIILLMSMLPIASFSYDRYAKWDLFSQTLPVSRKQIVMSKYLLGGLTIFSGTVLALFLNMLFSLFQSLTVNLTELVIINATIAMVALLFLATLIPLVYKFGVERSRMMTIAVFAIPSLIGFFLSDLGVEFSSLDKISPSIFLLVSLISVIGLMMVSYSISTKIYLKKDF